MKDRLGNHIQQVRGVSYKPSDLSENLSDGYTVLLRANNISEGRINFDSVQFVRNNKISQEQILKTNDILVCSSSGSISLVGKSALYKKSGEHTFGAFCKVVRATGKLHPQFIAFYMCSQAYRKHIEHIANGANINNLRNEHLDEIQLDIPTDDQQKVIVSKLEKIQSIITHRRTQLFKLDELIKCRFVEMFGTYPANEKGWKTGTIRDVIQEARYGASRPAVEGGQYPYLRMNNITYGGDLDLSDTKRINVPEAELPKCTVRRGDVLFNRTNSKELVGKTCVYNRDEMMVLAGFVIRVRVNDSVLPEFLAAFLNAGFSKHMLLNMCKSAIGQANINAQEMQDIEIYIPPISSQQEYVSFKNQIDKFKFVIQQSLDETQKLFDSFMQKYFDSW
ncbi:restriction endonuclease subunit S [Akkermansia muciniphila]|uniref:restriction endonuclease subunit S n=1 Tax=Akkermansia muciniphila TaxID=239935 RepID=UPI00201DE70B|nr:restriction endonuclease subunit S [Akkermansia muciniphila]MCL6681695.1 restriction endonuclease subunit S [Akkermansia muciniphila]